jgi:ABC-2 type transport system permease protein
MQTLKPEKPKQNEQDGHSVNPADLAFTARGNTWRNIRLILVREYKIPVRSKTFMIVTIIMVLLVVVASFVPTLIQWFSSNSQTKVVVITTTGPVAKQDVIAYLDQTLNVNTNASGINTQSNNSDYKITQAQPEESEALHTKVQNGDLDTLLTITRNQNGDLVFDYYTKNSVDGLSSTSIRQALTLLAINDRLDRSGLSQSQIVQLFIPPEIKAASVSDEKAGGKTGEERAASYFVALFLVIILFSTIYNYGVAIAQGAAEEKSNRIMEIMISAATPFQLMMGKIIGIGLVGFTQVLLVATSGVTAFLLQNPIKEFLFGTKTGGVQIDITKISINALIFFLIFYILGFMLYAALYAAVGSLVSRPEDVQAALAPLSIINIGAYLVAVFGLQAIDATWVTVLSYFPFFTPILMFSRLVLGSAQWWEGAISVVVLLFFTVIFTWLSSRVYRAGVLLYGRKPTTGQILKLMWSKGR